MLRINGSNDMFFKLSYLLQANVKIRHSGESTHYCLLTDIKPYWKLITRSALSRSELDLHKGKLHLLSAIFVTKFRLATWRLSFIHLFLTRTPWQLYGACTVYFHSHSFRKALRARKLVGLQIGDAKTGLIPSRLFEPSKRPDFVTVICFFLRHYCN